VELTRITDPSQIPILIHGTYKKHMDSILKTGLSIQTRQHIHFATGKYGQVVSGMRANCDTLIYINVPLAMQGKLTSEAH
jgi:2'-phosphotransferase